MWQDDALRWFRGLQETDPAILSVAPYGSVAEGTADAWSDLDLELTVLPGEFDRFFPSLTWFRPLGGIWIESREGTPEGGLTRVVFTDGRRIDLRILDGQTDPDRPPVMRRESLKTQANDFAHTAVIAIVKVMRRDLLIGAHLMLELRQTVLVCAMQARDRELGTTVHRFGGPLNDILFFLGGSSTSRWGVLTGIGDAVEGFRAIVGYEHPRWRWNWEPLQTMLTNASHEIEELDFSAIEHRDGEDGENFKVFERLLPPTSTT